MRAHYFTRLLPCLLLALVLLACSRQPRSTADVPTHLPSSYTVSVAPFSQPTNPSDLIMGRIPEPQGRILEEELARLDHELRLVLHDGKERRHFVFLNKPLKKESPQIHNAAQPQALAEWLAYGKAHKAEYLLVPQVLDWHERMGSKAGVTNSAAVHVEFFLLKIVNGTVMSRSIFAEKQQALTDNFFNLPSFIKRRASWVSATDLAIEGMQKAKAEFRL